MQSLRAIDRLIVRLSNNALRIVGIRKAFFFGWGGTAREKR
jgi:hypothetical protein